MGHCKGGPHMESAKQERKNLLDINPIAKHASGAEVNVLNKVQIRDAVKSMIQP